jgi:hypothetical protein
VADCNDHRLALAIVFALAVVSPAPAQSFVSQTKVRVTSPTTMDWGHAASGESRVETPQELTPGYKPTAQRFDPAHWSDVEESS